MKKILKYLPVMLAVIIITACSDDLPEPTPPTGDNDNFEGNFYSFQIHEGTHDITHTDGLRLFIKTPDGNVISRDCSHRRENNISNFTLKKGLKEGVYQLLRLEYDLDTPIFEGKVTTGSYGLGCRIAISNDKIEVLDKYNVKADMYGEGTKENPFIITDPEHLTIMMIAVNDDRSDEVFPDDVYFRQDADLNMYNQCFYVGNTAGWIPIGQQSTSAFKGHYDGNNHKITNLFINRPNAPSLGLFGNAHDAVIQNITLENASISGNFAIGGILGVATTVGDHRSITFVENCKVVNSIITGNNDSYAVAGIVGAVEQYARLTVTSCSTDDNTSISADFGAGGIVGVSAIYSLTTVLTSSNSANVQSKYSGTGGIIAAGDSVFVNGCSNLGKITMTGGTNAELPLRGTGGIAGGTGVSHFIACNNVGKVSGFEGVGGIIGSSRISGNADANASADTAEDPYVYNNVSIRYCGNDGNIDGKLCVGGIVGEAQAGCYATYNTGNVTATGDYAAGIVAITSIAVVHNSVNSGNISGNKYVAGIIGKTSWGSVAIDHNYGTITAADSHAAGIIGLAGNNTIINYCGNFYDIFAGGNGPAAGIVAEVGDPREWSAMNIAECVIGSIECVMAFAGPAFAIATHATKAIPWLHTSLEIIDSSIESALIITDTVLLGLSEYALKNEEEITLLRNTINAEVQEDITAVNTKIQNIRNSAQLVNSFSPTIISNDYNNNILSLTNFYETSTENAELFNENINLAREERAKWIAEDNRKHEIIHTVVGGIAIIVSVVATVGTTVASGGAAAPFVIAGSLASATGGANAIYKSCTDFADNAVIISQCVNAAYIMTDNKSSNNAGGIVGILHDKSIVRNCLNAAGGQQGKGGGHFVGYMKQQSIVENSLTIANQHYWYDLIGDSKFQSETHNLYYCNEDNMTSVPEIFMAPATRGGYSDYGKGLSTAQLADASYFQNWDIGEPQSPWIIPSKNDGNSFPIPFFSEMQKPLN